tara:strand:+ start:10351 stop:10839 length:489 start_codon:yes stop_codon:yes gene_type:complete
MGKEKDLEILAFYTKLTHYANFDIYGLLKSAPTFFKKYKYDFWETSHAEKPDGVGYTLQSYWHAVRDINDYVQFDIDMKFWIRNITKVVYDDGTTTYKGKMVVVIKAVIKKNYNESFGKSKMEEFMRQLYENYVRRKELLGYEDKLADECVDLEEGIVDNLQ